MALDIDLLRSSFDLAVEREPQLTLRFYAILFERHPEAAPLFGRNSRATQARMLNEALTAVLDRLEDGAWLEQTLEALGARHVDYGVTDEMYDWVGESLIAALAAIAGADWTPALERAWSEAFGAIASLMKAGAAKALRERSSAADAAE